MKENISSKDSIHVNSKKFPRLLLKNQVYLLQNCETTTIRIRAHRVPFSLSKWSALFTRTTYLSFIPSMSSKTFSNTSITSDSPHPFIQRVNAHLPNTLMDTDILKFLIASKNKQEVAYQRVKTHLEWREAFNHSSLLTEDFSALAESGKLFWIGNALDETPVLVWKAACHINTGDIQKDIRFVVYTVEKAKKEKVLVDKVTLIIDRLDFQKYNADPDLVKGLVNVLANHYPETLKRIFVFPKNFVLTVGWNVVKLFIDPVTAEKINMLNASDINKCMSLYISNEILPKVYGGNANDIESYLESYTLCTVHRSKEVEVGIPLNTDQTGTTVRQSESTLVHYDRESITQSCNIELKKRGFKAPFKWLRRRIFTLPARLSEE